ncbi:MAG: beta-ketoacyl-[acyl-carrier-protein] synthase family protein [Chthoniobacterales bacterium]
MPRPDSERVVVTGLGLVSPLGANLQDNVTTLRAARDCVTPVTTFDVSGCRSKTAGQIPDDWLAAASTVTPRARQQSRASRMTLLAVDEALRHAPDFRPDLAVIGTTSGGMTLGEDFYRRARDGELSSRDARLLRGYVPQQPAFDAFAPFGIDAPLRVLSNACASGTNAIGYAFHLVRAGRKRRVLCGGYDALAELVFAGFDSLQASTGEKPRPFDRARTGLALGEGAAIVLLESLADARAANHPILAEVTGYGDSTDNFHLTQPNPDGSGPRRSMETALTDAGLVPTDIDYVNAHGTATRFNDACEARAIEAVCPTAAVSSTKGQMGHALGAAGAIEAAFCVLALQHQFLPANLHFEAPDDDVHLDIVANSVRDTAPTRVLSNSLGFGGANATLILERAPA